MRVRNRIIIFCWLFFAPSACFAWGKDGHRIVAEIAFGYLDPKARAEIRTLLGHPTLTDVATWADEVRGESAYLLPPAGPASSRQALDGDDAAEEAD